MSLLKTERTSNFELLRIVAMCMIVAAHYAGHGIRHVLVSPLTNDWLSGSFFNRAFTAFLIPGGKIGVGVFFVLTGYFMIDKEYKVQRVLKLGLQVYFYAILMLIVWGGVQLYSVYTFPYMSSSNKLGLLLQVCFPITSNSWWFITSYILLFFLIPILNKMIAAVEDNRCRTLIALFLFIWYATSVFDFQYAGLQRAVFFYLSGAWIKRKQIGLGKWRAVALFCLAWCVFVFCDMIITGIIGQGSTGKLFTKCFECIEIAFCVPLAVISLFLFFKDIHVESNRFINTLAATTFGIYLFHDSNIGRQLIWDGILHVLDKQYVSSLFPLCALTSVLLVFATGFMIDFIRQKAFERKLLPFVEAKINEIFKR